MLVGPAGLAFAAGDAAATAKVLRDFARDHQKLIIKGGLLGSEVLPPERVADLADIEPREVLLSKIAGVFQAPMARMAGALAAMPRNLATMVSQLIEKMPAAPAAPARWAAGPRRPSHARPARAPVRRAPSGAALACGPPRAPCRPR